MKNGLRHIISVLILMLLLFQACFPEVELADIDGAYAIPLVDTDLNIVELAEASDQEIIVSEDEDSRLTVSYLGDVLSQRVIEIFPPFPVFEDIEFVETSGMVPLPVEVPFVITRARFKDTRVRLLFTSSHPEDVIVTFRFDEVFMDGEIFEREHFIESNGNEPVEFVSEVYDLTVWELIPENNEFLYTIEARTASGEIVELDRMAMSVEEVLNFSLIEGIFGERVFPLEDNIEIGVFNQWLSGGFVFEEPNVRIVVENSFGFPVRSRINELTLTTITDETFTLEAEGIENGILFDFPTLDEIGQSKDTEFIYSEENSNIGEIFNEKARSFRYNIDALINSEFDEEIIGFLTDNSAYRVQLALDVPLHLRLNDLRLTETIDLDLEQLADFRTADLKFVIDNAFPFDIGLEAHFIDTLNNASVSLFDEGGLSIQSAILNDDDSATSIGEQVTIVTIAEERLQQISNAHQIALIANFSNSEIAPDEAFWILSDYGIDLKIGAIVRNE